MFAALVVTNILAATGRADAVYSGSLQASLTIAGFLDAERNPISKPVGLTLASEVFSLPDSYTEGDATAHADGAFGVTVGDPLDLGAGDRIDFWGVVSGTTIYPSGYSFAAVLGFANIVVDNASPDPVTIYFDVDYDYAVSTSVDNPGLEYADASVGYYVLPAEGEIFPKFELFSLVESNESLADMGAGSFEVMLSAGQTETISVSAHLIGEPESTIPEPTTWILGAIGAALLLGAGRMRRSSDG